MKQKFRVFVFSSKGQFLSDQEIALHPLTNNTDPIVAQECRNLVPGQDDVIFCIPSMGNGMPVLILPEPKKAE